MNPKKLSIGTTFIALTCVSFMTGCSTAPTSKNSAKSREIAQANAEADEFATLFVQRSIAFFKGGIVKSEAVEFAYSLMTVTQRSLIRREAAKFLSREEAAITGQNIATFFDEASGRAFLSSLKASNKKLFEAKNLEQLNARMSSWETERLAAGSADAATGVGLHGNPNSKVLTEAHPNVAAAPFKHPELAEAIKQFLATDFQDVAVNIAHVFQKTDEVIQLAKPNSCKVVKMFKSDAAKTNVRVLYKDLRDTVDQLPAHPPADCSKYNISVAVFKHFKNVLGIENYGVMKNVLTHCDLPPAGDIVPYIEKFEKDGGTPAEDFNCLNSHALPAAASVEPGNTGSKLAQD